MTGWADLSDDELRERLTARGVAALHRAMLVRHRDEEEVVVELDRILGDG